MRRKNGIMSMLTQRRKMKDETLAIVIGVVFILWQFCILFGIWGGNPEGCFLRIKNLKTQVEELQGQIEELQVDKLKNEFINHRHIGIYGRIK